MRKERDSQCVAADDAHQHMQPTGFATVVANSTIAFEQLAASLPGGRASLGHRVADT